MRFLDFIPSILDTLQAHQPKIYGGIPPIDRRSILTPTPEINSIAPSTRAYWMRRANSALQDVTGTPCPFAAFGTVIVNHTSPGLGELVCIGANSNSQYGNPTLHGEIDAINNCSAILTDPEGKYSLSPSEALAAFTTLSLYTNAESCPMCASAIRWAGMREYVFGTSIEKLVELGWSQIDISSAEVFERSEGLGSETSLLGGVLSEETDVYFGWQFVGSAPCPKGCERKGRVRRCCNISSEST
jgi:tRNA(Arg) A34 adenosine deaminase TadA